MRALLPCLITVSATCISGKVLAEPWSTEPLVGVVGQYSSNPVLAAGGSTPSEANGALVVDAPVNYDADDFHFVVTPNIRYGNASGYSAVTSNYFHVDSSAQLSEELSSTTVNASMYRDSSLLYAGELYNGVGVRRDSSSFGAQWQRLTTERLQLQLAANSSRTLYAESASRSAPTGEQNALSDYRYTTFSPALAYSEDERDTLRLIGSAGRYEAIDGVSASNNANIAVGFDRLLSEIWTLKTTAGYSRAENRYNFFLGKYLLARFDSTQNGTVYSANLERKSDLLDLDFAASRALTPTGFAYLARQQSVNFTGNYSASERWTYGATANYQINDYPTGQGGASYQQRYYYASLLATWHATEQWSVTMQATKITQRYGSPVLIGTATGVSIQISRQFHRKDL